MKLSLVPLACGAWPGVASLCTEREIFIAKLLVRVHWIIEMIVVERPCAMGVSISISR